MNISHEIYSSLETLNNDVKHVEMICITHILMTAPYYSTIMNAGYTQAYILALLYLKGDFEP